MAALRQIDAPGRAVLVLDRDMTVVYANARATEVLARDGETIIGRPLRDDLLDPLKNAGRTEVFDDVLEDVPESGVIMHRHSVPVLDVNGKPAGRVEIYSDITARRELEREILDRNRELAELNAQLEEAQDQLIQSERLRALGEMAAGVAHDINNVLGVILGNVQLARRKIDSDSPANKCIDAIELAAKDAAHTVRRLREIGKPVDRSVHRVVDLAEVAREVVDSAVPAWSENGSPGGAEISVDVDCEGGCVVMGDAVELREALANILLNAAQSIESSGRIDIRVCNNDGCVELSVRDTGVGMSEETRKRLFDPFFTTRGAEGTGLGMSMVDAIAIRHNGKLLVDSEEGKGTTITMRLPLARRIEQE